MKPFNMRNIEGSYIEIIKKALLYFHVCRFRKGITGWRWNVPYTHWSLPTKKKKKKQKKKTIRMLLVWRSETWTGSCFVCNRFCGLKCRFTLNIRKEKAMSFCSFFGGEVFKDHFKSGTAMTFFCLNLLYFIQCFFNNLGGLETGLQLFANYPIQHK